VEEIAGGCYGWEAYSEVVFLCVYHGVAGGATEAHLLFRGFEEFSFDSS
jgi:hypothetical protein